MLGHPSKPGCTSPGRGVGWGGSRQEGLRLLGPLTLEEQGCGEGAALAGDISPGEAFEKFQVEEVSEQPAVQDPTPDTHTWVSTSQIICLVRPPVLEACTPARGWGPGAGLALCCPHPRTLWCLCSPGRRGEGVVVWGACISPQKAWSWLLGWAASWRVLVYLCFVTEMAHRHCSPLLLVMR